MNFFGIRTTGKPYVHHATQARLTAKKEALGIDDNKYREAGRQEPLPLLLLLTRRHTRARFREINDWGVRRFLNDG
jgi:hypothetical protein